jgi:Holliday junction resolvase RusA-like endonuclease
MHELTLARIARANYHDGPMTGAVSLEIVFAIVPPARSKRLYPHCRPDLDNYLKAFMDAVNGIYWVDDGQVVNITASKVYAPTASISGYIAQIK